MNRIENINLRPSARTERGLKDRQSFWPDSRLESASRDRIASAVISLAGGGYMSLSSTEIDGAGVECGLAPGSLLLALLDYRWLESTGRAPAGWLLRSVGVRTAKIREERAAAKARPILAPEPKGRPMILSGARAGFRLVGWNRFAGRPPVDLAGRVFDLLTAIEPTDGRSGSNIVWRCRCECGNARLMSTQSLKSEGRKSCGCHRKNRKEIAPTPEEPK